MKPDIFDIFCMGVDYGQLLMEEERDSEDMADAFQGMIISDKYSMPSSIAPRRQPHSKEWRAAKKASFRKFKDLLIEIKTKETADDSIETATNQLSFKDYL